ncbi:MAG: alpha/beta hydrolase [Dehalococcoidia bacterium]
MPTIDTNGIDLWYELRGEGPLLALSHGWMGPTEFWPPKVIDELSKHLRLLLYDVRGHGKTTAPEDLDSYSMPQYASDLRALLDALELERVHIGGVSQGGMIAAQFAVDYPERTRSLVLSDSTAGNGADEGPGGEWERTMAQALGLMEELARAEGVDAVRVRRMEYDQANDPHYFDYPVPLEERLAKDAAEYAQLTLHGYIGTNRAVRNRPDLTARLRELQMPALVIGGEWDSFYPCSVRDHALLEGSRFVTMRYCGHASPDWRPDAFVRAVTKFIADVDAGRDVAGELEL